MSDLVVQPIALVGGLQDSKARPEPSDFVRLQNWTTFRGRFALRSPIFLTTTLTSSDANATRALAGAYHDGKLWLAVFRDANDDVRLWELTAAGVFTADRGAIWTGITGAVPRPIFAPFEGGTATGGTKRLYIADYDAQQITKFWDGVSISSLQVDFDNSGAAEDVKFHYVFPYQYHLWGAGFYQGTTGRSEMLRFSQPGLIPADDPDTTAGTLVEWHAADFRSVGRRGDKIINLGSSGGPMIVFKNFQTYALFGYDSQSWAIRQLSERAGAVGPYASASTGDGYCFFWSDRGPMVTDGQEVIDLSESVRKHVLEFEVSDKNVVGFSPDDGIVYFGCPRGGSTDPDYWLAFDKERKSWTEGDAIAVGGGVLGMKHFVAVPSTALVGPVAAPSGVTLTVVDENNIDVTWVNGDIALDTTTEIYYGTSAAPTTLFGSPLSSGVTSVRLSGLVAKTTYFVRARHKRNTIFSGYSNEPSAKTKLTRPSSLDAIPLSNGNRISLTNNEAGADIPIERRRSSFLTSGGITFPPELSFATITTLLAQTTGVKTFDDTTGTVGAEYEYRARVTKAGETTSEYSNTDRSLAGGGGGGGAPSVTACAHVFDGSTVCANVDVTWSFANAKPSDTVRISRNLNGAGYTVVATVPLTAGSWNDTSLGWKAGSVSKSLQYQLETLDNGTAVVDTDTTTLSNQNVDDCTGFF